MVGVRGEQFPRKNNALKCQTGPLASTDFKGVSAPLSNRANTPGPQNETAALGFGAQHGEILKDRKNLRQQYSAPGGDGAIAVPALSWAQLSYDQQSLWLAILHAADRENALPRWAGDFLHEVFLAGDGGLSPGDVFSLDALMRYCAGALGIGEGAR